MQAERLAKDLKERETQRLFLEAQRAEAKQRAALSVQEVSGRSADSI